MVWYGRRGKAGAERKRRADIPISHPCQPLPPRRRPRRRRQATGGGFEGVRGFDPPRDGVSCHEEGRGEEEERRRRRRVPREELAVAEAGDGDGGGGGEADV